MRWTVLALACALALPGCSGVEDPPPTARPSGSPTTTASPRPTLDCDLDAALPPSPAWAAHGGQWASFVQPDLAHPQGTRGQGDPGEPGLGLLVDHATGSFAAVDLTVDLLLVQGSHPDGAGVVFHWSGASHNIVRYSPSEGGWHVFTVIDGERTKINATAPATLPAGPGWCSWTTLRVVADGGDVEVFQDGDPVLRATLPDGARRSGEAGLFVRGETVALFEGYSASTA